MNVPYDVHMDVDTCVCTHKISKSPTHFKAVVRYGARCYGSPSCTLQIHKLVPSLPNPSKIAMPSCFLMRHTVVLVLDTRTKAVYEVFSQAKVRVAAVCVCLASTWVYRCAGCLKLELCWLLFCTQFEQMIALQI